jgi:sugar porter (SP) family MFS transporter
LSLKGDAGAAHARRTVVLTAAIAGLGGLLFGYDTGVIAGALLFIGPDFDLSSFQSGLVVGAVPIGAVVGAAFAGRLSDEYGRRRLILWSAVVFVIGSGVAAAAPDTGALVAARIVLGVAIGLASATAPVYISEVAPPAIRGRLVTFFQLAVTIGIVVAYLVGLAFDSSENWRAMLAIGAVPAFALGLGMARMPQSPRWLVMAGRRDEAHATLERIRSEGEAAIEQELEEIEGDLKVQPGGWRDLAEPAIRAALVVGVGLAVLQQVSGINTVIYYAPTIIGFTGIDSSSAAILASAGVGIVNVGMTLVAIRLLDRVGRRPLLIAGSATMAVALSGLALIFLSGDHATVDSVIAVGSLMLYVGAFAVSLGPIFWLLNAEIYPLRVRSKAAAVGTMANWFFNFVVSLTFLLLIDGLGQSGAFFFYAAICVVTLIFCRALVPETKGKPLEEIEAEFQARAAS